MTPASHRQGPYLPFCLTVFALLCLSACGGSSGGGGTTPSATVSGRALLGPICGAEVSVFDYDDLETAIHTTVTVDADTLSAAGSFEIPASLLADDALYVVKVHGGIDVDADDDGVRDDTPTENHGTLHLVATGTQVKAGDFHVNILTDLVYQRVAYQLEAEYPMASILTDIEQLPAALLREDVDGDGVRGMGDILAWHPYRDRDKTISSPNLLSICAEAILADRPYADERASIYRGIYSASSGPDKTIGLFRNENHLYVAGRGSGLLILDINDPARPQRIGSLDTPGQASVVFVSGGHAYVGDGEYGLQIIDIGEPARPSVVSRLDLLSEASGMVVSGSYAYVAQNHGGLKVIDVRDKRQPEVVGSFDATRSNTKSLSLRGDYLYLAHGGFGFLVIDIGDPENPTLAASVEGDGWVESVLVHEDLLLLKDQERGLLIYDLSDPVQPALASEVELPCSGYDYSQWPHGMVVSGGTAYVPDGDCGLHLIDIGDSQHPVITKSFDTPSEAQAVALGGAYVYVADTQYGIQVIDTGTASIPIKNSPALISKLDTPGWLPEIALTAEADYAYIAGNNGGVSVIDIGDPEAPALMASLERHNGEQLSCADIAIGGDFAYFNQQGSRSYGQYDDQHVMDISDPRHPQIASTGNAFGLLEDVTDIITDGGHAYVANATNSLQVFDLGEPANPAPLGALGNHWHEIEQLQVAGQYAYTVGHPGGLQVIDLHGSPHAPIVSSMDLDVDWDAISFSNGFAFVSKNDLDTRFYGLEIIDMRDPLNPVSVATVETPDEVYAIEVRDQYAYLMEKSTGLLTMDVSNPATPLEIGALNETSDARNLALDGDYAFIPGSGPTLKIIDISDPAHPARLSELDTGLSAVDLVIDGNYLYLAIDTMHWEGLQVVDISDPTTPVHVGSLKLIDWVESIVVKDHYAYLGGGVPGFSNFQVVDIHDPTKPTLMGVYDLPGEVLDLAIYGEFVVAAVRKGGLQIMDVSDPARPVIAKTLAMPAPAAEIALSGDYAYLADHQYGLQVIDVSDPGKPVRLNGHQTPGESKGIAVKGNYAIIVEGDSPVQIVDIRDPDQPTIAASIHLPGDVHAIAVSGDYAYAAADWAGLQVVDMHDPANPILIGGVDTPGQAYDVAVGGGHVYVGGTDGQLSVYRAFPDN